MDLAGYFEKHQGLGILATADSDGTVDLAIYAKPLVVNENTVAFVMREQLTHQNLKSSLHAAYMFVEQGEGYHGKRLYLSKIREETNVSLVAEIVKKQPEICAPDDDSNKHITYFQVDNIWPLVGDKSIG